MTEDILDSNPEELSQERSELSYSGGYNRVWITTEREAAPILTREDILELGFLRSDPERKIYKHINNTKLTLVQYTARDFGVKDFMVQVTRVLIWNMPEASNVILYNSNKANKEEIELAIKEYAG